MIDLQYKRNSTSEVHSFKEVAVCTIWKIMEAMERLTFVLYSVIDN